MDMVSLNGQILSYDEARIAPGDAGFLHGAGLFETMRVRHSKIFRAADHLARLTASAAAFGLEFALTLPELEELTAELLTANSLIDARLRLTLTRGDLHAATAESPNPGVTLLLTSAPFSPYPAALFEKGMTVIASRYKQIPQHPLTGHKSTSYFDRILALRQANKAGAGEALWFTPDNMLAEGCISNVFIVDKDGHLVTPPLTVPDAKGENANLCLPGITRKQVLELAATHSPQERLLTIHDLLTAKEIFLTNAIMTLMPVTHLEQHAVGTGKPGTITQNLRAAYEARLVGETTT